VGNPDAETNLVPEAAPGRRSNFESISQFKRHEHL